MAAFVETILDVCIFNLLSEFECHVWTRKYRLLLNVPILIQYPFSVAKHGKEY